MREELSSSGRRAFRPAAGAVASNVRLRRLRIAQIRRDGDTQSRVVVDPRAVKEYAVLMQAGVEFPPVRVWFDGSAYWLADGFQRVAAAESIGRKSFPAEIHDGTLREAQWDSYGANSTHGARRTKPDTELAIRRALSHPNATHLSNVAIAKHLGMAEATVRRWRRRSSSDDEDGVRVANRHGREYTIRTTLIGHRKKRRGGVPSPAPAFAKSSPG